jgi:RNA polymerase sigma-70 factor (ECF subfamily)
MDALARIYWAEVGRVHGFARSRVGESEAEDITSEVFHAAALAARDGRMEQVTPSWLMAVARNKVIDRWRMAARRKAKLHLLATEDTTLPPNWTADERRADVLAALDRLKPRHRTLLILHHVDGMSIRDLAEAADQSQHAVESALARARLAFRRCYKAGGRND